MKNGTTIDDGGGIRSCLRWAGGKARLAKYIVPLIPVHHCYCEPFCGGLGLFLAKPKSRVEVLNDTHACLVRFWRCVKYHSEALLEELEFEVQGRRVLKDYLAQPGLTDIQMAARWFVRNNLSFGGRGDTYAVGTTQKLPLLENKRTLIKELAARLDGVSIEQLDYRRCIQLYDRAESFFFCDPPYVGCSEVNYPAWSKAQMEELAACLAGVQGKWLLTVNDCEMLRGLFKDYQQKRVARHRGVNNKPGQNPEAYRELIIRNYA